MHDLLTGGSPNDFLVKPDLNVHGNLPYETALSQVRERVAVNMQKNLEDISETDLKGMILRDIESNKVKCALTRDPITLANYIYHDMAGLSFISREGLFEKEGFEEININGWDDVEIVIDGERRKTDYGFLSPQQAYDIMLRIFRRTKTAFDEARPEATADIGSGIRITAQKPPLIDDERGISASIRKVNRVAITRERILSNQTITTEMMRFLELCLKHGVSMCISGETGAGKTTLAGTLLFDAADTLRIYTIEEGAREWDFIRRDPATNKITNSVIHTKTRLNKENPTLNIDQETLCKLALRYDPDIVAPSEIRGREAFEVMSIANTGHTVCTTIHSNGTADTPGRVVELAKKAYDMADNTLYAMFVRAFPILVHMKKGDDRGRRVTEICEVLGFKNGELQSQMIFSFRTEDNIRNPDGSVRVEGEFARVSPISGALAQRLLDKGATRKEIEYYRRENE